MLFQNPHIKDSKTYFFLYIKKFILIACFIIFSSCSKDDIEKEPIPTSVKFFSKRLGEINELKILNGQSLNIKVFDKQDNEISYDDIELKNISNKNIKIHEGEYQFIFETSSKDNQKVSFDLFCNDKFIKKIEFEVLVPYKLIKNKKDVLNNMEIDISIKHDYKEFKIVKTDNSDIKNFDYTKISIFNSLRDGSYLPINTRASEGNNFKLFLHKEIKNKIINLFYDPIGESNYFDYVLVHTFKIKNNFDGKCTKISSKEVHYFIAEDDMKSTNFSDNLIFKDKKLLEYNNNIVIYEGDNIIKLVSNKYNSTYATYQYDKYLLKKATILGSNDSSYLTYEYYYDNQNRITSILKKTYKNDEIYKSESTSYSGFVNKIATKGICYVKYFNKPGTNMYIPPYKSIEEYNSYGQLINKEVIEPGNSKNFRVSYTYEPNEKYFEYFSLATGKTFIPKLVKSSVSSPSHNWSVILKELKKDDSGRVISTIHNYISEGKLISATKKEDSFFENVDYE